MHLHTTTQSCRAPDGQMGGFNALETFPNSLSFSHSLSLSYSHAVANTLDVVSAYLLLTVGRFECENQHIKRVRTVCVCVFVSVSCVHTYIFTCYTCITHMRIHMHMLGVSSVRIFLHQVFRSSPKQAAARRRRRTVAWPFSHAMS